MASSAAELAEFYLQQISSGIGFFILLLLLIYHSRQQCSNKSKKKTSKLQFTFFPPSLLTCSFLLIFFGLIYCIIALSELIWVTHISVNRKSCFIHFILLLCSYSIFKLILYIALCRQIVEAFGDAHSYPPMFLIIYQILLIIITFALMISAILFIKQGVDETSIVPCSIAVFPDALLISVVLFDFIVCGIDLFLFLKPIYKLGHMSDQNKKVQTKFNRLIRKTALLASISIVTSFITWIFIGILDMAVFFQVIDVVITTVSIILLFKKNEKIFFKICCFCCYYFKKELYDEQEPTSTRSHHSLNVVSTASKTPVSTSNGTNPNVLEISNVDTNKATVDEDSVKIVHI